jgi:hypothetical protein
LFDVAIVEIGGLPMAASANTLDINHYHQHGIAYNTRTKEWLSTVEHIIPSLPTFAINNNGSFYPIAPISCMTTNGLWIRKFMIGHIPFHCYNTRTNVHSTIKPIHHHSTTNQPRLSPKFMLPLSNGDVLLNVHYNIIDETDMTIPFHILNPMNGEVTLLRLSKLPGFDRDAGDSVLTPIIMDYTNDDEHVNPINKEEANDSSYDQQLLILPTCDLFEERFQCWLAVILFPRNKSSTKHNTHSNVTIGEWYQCDIPLPAHYVRVEPDGIMNIN